MSRLIYQSKTFQELSVDELYGILRLRAEIFVVEQDCAYQDIDNVDQASIHLFGSDASGEILAYTRLVPIKVSYQKYASIGRVVLSKKMRRTGAGKELMNISIKTLKENWADPIKISAQCYLDKFYTDLGFRATGEKYLEDGIPHQAMIYQD